MSAESIAYPFLFLAVFFESFLLVSFLSAPARSRRKTPATPSLTPRVAVVVPCWNEETTVQGTIESLLALDYPADKLSIILVNDGSTDNTGAVIDAYASHPQITALHKENGGKHSAMNLGIGHAKGAELIGFLDADSFVAPDALKEIVHSFSSPEVMATTVSMSIHEPRTFLQRMQYAEYTLGITLRHVFASMNGLYVTPGPFSFYRRSLFAEVGLFKNAHLTEDMEMAMRIQRAGYTIANALYARVYTKGPPTLRRLIKQRVRWTTGFLRNLLFEYRDLIGGHNPVLGFLVLPLGVTAIVGGVLLFIVSMADAIRHSWHALSVAQTAPLSYLVSSWRVPSWYDLPITYLALMGGILALLTITWMAVGKHISRTPGRLAPNVLFYLSLYWLVAPLWLLRSVSEVVLGARTTWR
jgi:cellulose synthase/poly-beta-1,6-N-acetylglucosamine synthase-like glycosyltransferase